MLTAIIAMLQAAFIFCKLAGLTAIAAWSWFWVMSPLLGLVTFWFIMLLVIIIAGGFGYWADYQRAKNSRKF
jgi:fatty acid desaturase